jgi:hypothetical protein
VGAGPAPARTNPKIRECRAADTYPDQSMQHIAMTAADLSVETLLPFMTSPRGKIKIAQIGTGDSLVLKRSNYAALKPESSTRFAPETPNRHRTEIDD